MEDQTAFAGALEPKPKLVITELNILSVKKFLLLSFLSVTLYPLWWTYKVWRFFKDKEGSNIHPAIRTIFGVFFLIPLFNRILNFAASLGYKEKYHPVLLFIGILTFNLLSYAPQPFWLVSVFSVFFFLPPLMAFNYALANSPEIEVEVQHSFNTRQIILMSIGGIVWLFTLLGLLFKYLALE